MKKIFTLLFAAAAMTVVTANVYADGTFLCMQPDESVAITSNENHDLTYISMVASNGERVYPQISTDGNTYLPFRYVCEMAGLKDGAGISGDLPDGYFRFWDADSSVPGDKQKIEIQYNGNYYCHNVNEMFRYEAKPGDVRTVSIYNIRGSLYFPMTYMAKITNAQAIWQDDSKRIIYVSNGIDASEYLNEKNDIKREKELYLGFDFYCNNLGNSPLYLKSNGTTIQNLSDELQGNPDVKSVTRSGNVIYFINSDKHIYTKIEDDENIIPLTFTDKDGNKIDFMADTLMAVKNKLYGIQINSENEVYGRLFSANLDGTDFEYITDKTVYNLILKKYKSNLYLFCCDASTKANINMIELKTMDKYDVRITDYEHKNLLSDIKKFVVGDKFIAYLTNGNKLHIIDIKDNLEEYEIIKVNESNNRLFLEGDDGGALTGITSLNFDYINNVLYITQVDDMGKTYYYARPNDSFIRLEQSDMSITDVALFNDVNDENYCAKTVGGRIQIDKVKYSDGNVRIVE